MGSYFTYSYLSFRITDSFPQILKLKIKRLKPALLARGVGLRLMLIKLFLVLIFVENCLKVEVNFSIWLRTCSNPLDINRFQSHTGKSLPCIIEEFYTLLQIVFLNMALHQGKYISHLELKNY